MFLISYSQTYPKNSDTKTATEIAYFIGFCKISVLKNANFEDVEKRYVKIHYLESNRSQEHSKTIFFNLKRGVFDVENFLTTLLP